MFTINSDNLKYVFVRQISMLDKFIEAFRTQNTQKIEEIINQVVDDKDSTIIKCRNCGEIIAFQKTKILYGEIMKHGYVRYLVLEHMKKDPNHDVVIPVNSFFDYPISKTLETKLKLHCSRGDENGSVDYETWFPTYVEYYYNKYITKEETHHDS